MAANTTQLTSSEEAQLAQTIEMFEVITQSQPQDYQSLEILKEAYAKFNALQALLHPLVLIYVLSGTAMISTVRIPKP